MALISVTWLSETRPAAAYNRRVEQPPDQPEAPPPPSSPSAPPDERPLAIVVEHLTKRFDKVLAVDDISFDVRKGEIFGLAGESGCGKTTAGKTILRLLEPTSGKVYFEGRDITALNKVEMKELRRRMQSLGTYTRPQFSPILLPIQ